MNRLRFDVYGRFRVIVEEVDGIWSVYRIGADGKRRRLDDVVVPDGADPGQVVDALEATFHELATPDTTIVPLER